MGVNLRELVSPIKKEITLASLANKIIALDAYNILHQFLAIIRQRDGTPLIDARGNITSHLNGLFYRTINLLENGIKPVYVFDGKPPELKLAEVTRRMQIREEAERKYREALARGDLEEARIYAQQTGKLTTQMVEDSKRLLTYMGIPWVQAPSEGEAQAAYMTMRGDVWASASQDYDSLLFGSLRLVRNLGITGKRKLPRKNIYVEVRPELIVLEELLKHYGITRKQLIAIGILLGTDYAPEGVKGIGIKRALRLIKEIKNTEKIFSAVRWEYKVSPEEIMEIFLNPEVAANYELKWMPPDREKVIRFLVDEHQFSLDRVSNALDRAEQAFNRFFRQQTLESWFGFG